ncbi:hypothetical protein [Pandoraea apista]|uniref:hypothetical protein n=1 Tax=Pandoraea apista TaxID=93218 RepID=UPI0006585337|nr:hypothetical protein [Pandoraea apista]ALS68383.1 hypothetical protein AT395_24875 [Pandoraea apista]CFB60475.1 hypothetical protein LMG16407_00514 [Pandoraea apista]
MQTRYFGEVKALGFDGKWYPDEEALQNAIVQAEWAKGILAGPDTVWPNGRHSHEAASAVLDESLDTLCAREFFFAS